MADKSFDQKLNPEFDSTAMNPPLLEWLKKTTCLQKMCGIKRLEHILSPHVNSKAFAVYKQLSEEEKSDVAEIKQSTINCFFNRQIHGLQTVYGLSFIIRRVSMFILQTYKSLLCCLEKYWNMVWDVLFVVGLLNHVKQRLQALSQID